MKWEIVRKEHWKAKTGERNEQKEGRKKREGRGSSAADAVLTVSSTGVQLPAEVCSLLDQTQHEQEVVVWLHSRSWWTSSEVRFTKDHGSFWILGSLFFEPPYLLKHQPSLTVFICSCRCVILYYNYCVSINPVVPHIYREKKGQLTGFVTDLSWRFTKSNLWLSSGKCTLLWAPMPKNSSTDESVFRSP